MPAVTSALHANQSCRPILAWAVLATLTLSSSGVAWAFSPDMLPSSAIWTRFIQKIHEPRAVLVHEQDTNGDGVPDLKVYRHEDGSYIDVKLKPGPDGMVVDMVVLRENLKDKSTWVYGYDKSGDGAIDMVVRGWFAEGKWDQMILDTTRDGRPDTFLLDIDRNGVYDCMGRDIDGDGRLDFLYDLDNKTGEILNETVGWVTFREQQHRDALPHLVYSFIPELNTLTGEEPLVVNATWDFGDGVTRTNEELVPAEKMFAKPGAYEVALDVQFRMPGAERVYKAWYGISLPVEPPPPGPPPLTPERLRGSIATFYGACGFVTAEEQPREGPISQLYPDLKLPEAAPAGTALRTSAVAPGELDLAVFWWRSEAEATAFLDALEDTDQADKLPALVARATAGTPFEIVSKVRARMVEKDGVRIAAWRDAGFIVTISTNRTPAELQRWTRLFYDILHPPAEPPPGD